MVYPTFFRVSIQYHSCFHQEKKDDKIGKPQIANTHELSDQKHSCLLNALNLTIKLSCKLDNMR